LQSVVVVPIWAWNCCCVWCWCKLVVTILMSCYQLCCKSYIIYHLPIPSPCWLLFGFHSILMTTSPPMLSYLHNDDVMIVVYLLFTLAWCSSLPRFVQYEDDWIVASTVTWYDDDSKIRRFCSPVTKTTTIRWQVYCCISGDDDTTTIRRRYDMWLWHQWRGGRGDACSTWRRRWVYLRNGAASASRSIASPHHALFHEHRRLVRGERMVRREESIYGDGMRMMVMVTVTVTVMVMAMSMVDRWSREGFGRMNGWSFP